MTDSGYGTYKMKHFFKLFLHATAAAAVARLSHSNSVRSSVYHTGGSVKKGES